MEIPKDITAAQKVTALMEEPFCACQNRHTAEELIGMLGAMEAVVGMRLHSLVFSAAGGTPTVGISYDVKVDSFVKDMGSDACIPVEELETEALKAEIDKVMGADREKAVAAAAALCEREKLNRKAAAELLQQWRA